MILSPHERMITGRYLRAKRSESFIALIIGFAVIGIALGVMTLVVVTSIMNGVRGEMLKHFIGLSGHVNVYHRSGEVPDNDSLLKEIAQMSAVKHVIPVIDGQVMVTARGVARGAQVKAYDISRFKDDSHLSNYVQADSWQRFKQNEGLLVGSGIARSLPPQSNLTLISPDGRQTIVGMIPRMKAYPVVGDFSFGLNMVDDNLILMSYEKAQTYFKKSGAGAYEITLNSLDDTADFAAALRKKLGGDYMVLDWQQTNGAVFEALNVQRTVMFLILMMIILVAAFNIIASLVMLVKDKQRDIAVMRAFGVTRKSIQKIFVTMGVTIGAFATFIGVVLGIIISLNAENFRAWFEATFHQKLLGGNLYFLSTLPAKIDWMEVLFIIILALVLSYLATLYPARRAAKLQPAEALRYE